MLENGLITIYMVLGFTYFKILRNMLDTGQKTDVKDKAPFILKMEMSFKENGLMIKDMVLALRNLKMALFLKANSLVIKEVDLEFSGGLMGICMLASGKMVRPILWGK